jgi:sigma-B regulation protein RsbU (phosphoserine phosphatase)
MKPATTTEERIHERLRQSRQQLETAAAAAGAGPEIARLQQAVDAALESIDQGTFGLCQTCHDPIEPERLLADPLIQFCLDHLTAAEQRALEADLDLAARVQRGLLPERTARFDGWEMAYVYEPAGAVSGDYCDAIRTAGGALYFMVGDVSGKGVAAAMLMSQLHAMFRTLIALDLPLAQIVERASRTFCESTVTGHYATLVCGRAAPDGAIELCNAGHVPPLVSDAAAVRELPASGPPLGMFCDERFDTVSLSLAPGSTLLLYTDGISESMTAAGEEFGRPRLAELCVRHATLQPRHLIERCLTELSGFLAGAPRHDDLTIMALRRASP